MTRIFNEAITAVGGIRAAARHIGIRWKKKDFLVVYSDKLCAAAMVGTKNKFVAAPVAVSRRQLKKSGGYAQAIVVNSGNANACTGLQGRRDAYQTARVAARELGIDEKHVLVASTGIIGKQLPMEKIRAGLKNIKSRLCASPRAGLAAARAIMTTDTVPKYGSVSCGGAKIAAIAKGSGMIHPNMGTMLCFIVTDAIIAPPSAKIILKRAVADSFNMLSVDGDTSTNDMVVLLAGNEKAVDKIKFQRRLTALCAAMAEKIAADGEGATKLMEARVIGARTRAQGRKAARAIVSSNLVKTAIFGNDPNWGRIACAVGYSGANVSSGKTDIHLGKHLLAKNGCLAPFNPAAVSDYLKKNRRIDILVNLHAGGYRATAWGCDLSYQYVKINGKYHT